MKTILKLEQLRIYGRALLYPRCKTSEVLAQLAGTKTLNQDQITLLESIGYRIVWATAKPTVSKGDV
jgi:hypothetical protein